MDAGVNVPATSTRSPGSSARQHRMTASPMPVGPSSEAPPPLRTRVSELLGVDYPLIQAPMGFIARAQLASAVSNAGGFGIVETSSGRLDEVREEMAAMRDLTDKPWGVNIAQMLVADPHIVEFVAGQGVRFVTTSAGDPARYTSELHDAGITVFHVVPSLRAAQKAVAAGVDGLVVEGGEGGGFKSTRPVSTFVLLPQICDAFDVPVIAAGGIVDGVSMAAAFALGAEGVQMGTRMVSAAESPVHENYKKLVTEADATDTVVLQRPLEPRLPGHADSLQRGPRARAVGRHGTDRRHGGRPQALFRRGPRRRLRLRRSGGRTDRRGASGSPDRPRDGAGLLRRGRRLGSVRSGGLGVTGHRGGALRRRSWSGRAGGVRLQSACGDGHTKTPFTVTPMVLGSFERLPADLRTACVARGVEGLSGPHAAVGVPLAWPCTE